MHPSEVDCAYLAGVLDGEGCFSVNGNRRHEGSGAIQYKNRVQFVSTCEEVVTWAAVRFGGNTRTKIPPVDWHEVTYTWALEDKNELIRVLPLVLPFLVIKKVHAQLLLKYCLSISSSTNAKLSDEERELRSAYCVIFKDLNSRGRGSTDLKSSCVEELLTLNINLPVAAD